LLHKRFASPVYLHWALVMLGGTLLIIPSAATHYLRSTGGAGYWDLLVLFFLFGVPGELLFGYGVPRVAHCAVGIRISAARRVLYNLFAVVLGAQVVVEGLTEDDVVAALRTVSMIAWMGYGYAILISAARTVTEPNRQTVIRAFLATGSVVLPIMLFLALAGLFLPGSVAFRNVPVASLLWLSAYSILSIVLIVRFHFGPHDKVSSAAPDQFVRMFSISVRESEVIHLILQGNTEAHIGDLLFISRRTVVNHVYNIYRKTGVSNRMQLINLMNMYELPGSHEQPFP
jgi:DNA-binding CsgD family transcriptional regulator